MPRASNRLRPHGALPISTERTPADVNPRHVAQFFSSRYFVERHSPNIRHCFPFFHSILLLHLRSPPLSPRLPQPTPTIPLATLPPTASAPHPQLASSPPSQPPPPIFALLNVCSFSPPTLAPAFLPLLLRVARLPWISKLTPFQSFGATYRRRLSERVRPRGRICSKCSQFVRCCP